MMTRRRFLAAATAAAVLPGCGRTTVRRRSVVVVGAGLAGLAAADAASRDGWDVTVLEAEDRVGGRVLTARDVGDRTVELGGEFIDASHEAMLGLARRYALGIDDLRELGTDLPPCAPRRSFAAAERRWYRALDSLSGRYLDRSSAGDLLDRLRLAPAARDHIAHALVRDDYGVEPEDLSLLFLVRSERLEAFGEERFRVRLGNDLIPAALARELGDRVQLGARVTAIAQDDAGVTVTAGDESLRADACVVAAPLPALRDVAFAPALPAPLAQAVARLRYATVTKVLLRYEGAPWRRAGCSGDAETSLPISTTWESAPDVLTVYTAGAPGRAFVAMDDEERIAAATAGVAELFPAAEPIAARTAAWPHAWVAYAPGQVRPFLTALRRPVGRIVLAGEHTAELSGYMEGAVRSGRTAARAIAAVR